MKVLCGLIVVILAAAATVAAKPETLDLKLHKLKAHQKHQQQSDLPQSRIIDGNLAEDRSAPYLVTFSISRVAYSHHCAGALISKEWIVTAAHCIEELKKLNDAIEGLPVYAGLRNREQLDEAQVRHIDFAFSHKDFDGEEGDDDIALVHVSSAFELSSRVRPIPLPYKHEKFDGKDSTTYGWGLDRPDAVSYVSDLRVARGKVLNQSDCLSTLPENSPVTKNEICVDSSACYGDGGSPLVLEHGEGVAELIGVTSWGYLPCGRDNRPVAYTAVAAYVDWIIEVQWAYNTLH